MATDPADSTHPSAPAPGEPDPAREALPPAQSAEAAPAAQPGEPSSEAALTPRQVHDALVKGVLGRPEEARGFLRVVLPPRWGAAIASAALVPGPTNVVARDLRQGYLDLLFDVTFAGFPGGGEAGGAPAEASAGGAGGAWRAQVLVLFEHVTSPDPRLPLRLGGYQLALWEQQLDRAPGAWLAPVIPVVLAQGKAPWRGPRTVRALLDPRWWGDREAGELAAQATPAVEPVVLDLVATPVPALLAAPWPPLVRAMLHLLALARRDPARMEAALVDAARALLGHEATDDQVSGFELLVVYHVRVVEAAPDDAFYVKLAQAGGPRAQEVAMTAAQKLHAAGRVEEARRILERLLRKRLAPIPEAVLARLQAASLEQLEAWTDRVFDGAQLEDLWASG